MRWASLLLTGLATGFLVIGVGSPQPSAWAAPPARPVDVLVYGGTPGGIAAALAASQAGAKVVLIEPTAHVGGLMTSGLSHTDFRTFEGVNGTFLKFAERVEADYRHRYGADSAQVKASRRGSHGEPHINERVFDAMLAERPNLSVQKGMTLSEVKTQAEANAVSPKKIIEAVFKSKTAEEPIAYKASIFIDGTYEGDLMAQAGVHFRVGREARSEYDESLAPPKADAQVQAYNFRLIMTQDPALRVEVSQPEGYRREDYLPVIPLLEKGGIKTAFGYPTHCVFKAHTPGLPNGKFDINDVSRGIIRLSLPGQNLEWPEGDAAARARVFSGHLNDTLGLVWFLQHDEAVPDSIRAEASRWGLCRDEFTDNEHLPWQLYVREARRMVGRTVFTERHTEAAPGGDSRSRFQADAIAMGDYGPNCHGTAHAGPRFGGEHTGEFYKRVAPYQIPYGVILPLDVDNLLVPVACSSSHVGFCALRLEPIWMSLGHASGVAARLALADTTPLAEIPVARIQTALHQEGAATLYVSDISPNSDRFQAVQWLGSLGGLHGLVTEITAKQYGERGKNIESQYYEKYPHHQFQPDKVLDQALLDRWVNLLPESQRARAKAEIGPLGPSLTRGKAVSKLFQLAQSPGT